ncbi:MAG: hypothetical protein JWL62_3007 [Hyphomicrobiales bacterium]|nr:hypothetical protein [Hyphomicrobiales bacterium]
MAQDKGKSGADRTQRGPTPNRDRRRDPGIIEGEVIRNEDEIPAGRETPVSPTEPPAAEAEALSSDAPQAAETMAQDAVVEEPAAEAVAPEALPEAPHVASTDAPAPERRAMLPTLAALAALLLAGTSLYIAWTAERGGVTPEVVAALGQRLDKIEGRLGAVEAKPTALMPDLGPLAARIGAVETKVDGARADASRALQQNAGLAPAASPAPRVDLSPLDRRIQALETRPVPTFDPAPLERRVSRIETELTPLRSALTAPKTEVRATQAPTVVETPPGDAAAAAVVAESLRQKLDRGVPFPMEVAALEKLNVDASQLGALKAMALKGAPTGNALADSFEPLAAATLKAEHKDPSADFLDRLARSATTLVRVRPVGETSGEDTAALISRIEPTLRRGDIAGALALWDRLPGDAKGPSRDWADRARLRAQADTSVRQIIDQAIERLGRTK